MTDTDDHLAAAASSGDSDAAGEFFRLNHRLLRVMAGRISVGVMDPEDLLSEVMVTIVERWARGQGPTSDPTAYIIKAMRNRVTDELRSPRSRVTPLPEAWEAPAAPEIDRVELHREFKHIARALQLLPGDQRSILTATVIDGRKPGDLVSDLGRPAPALHSLNRRAKLSFRRAVLRSILEDDAPEGCLEAARGLPGTVSASFSDGPESLAMSHIRQCERCQKAWLRFGALSSAYGVVGLLASSPLIDPAPASSTAAAGGGADQQSVREAYTREGATPVSPDHFFPWWPPGVKGRGHPSSKPLTPRQERMVWGSTG